jgi:hypothetical protein
MSTHHPHSFGPAGMPSPRSQTALYFSGKVKDSWEDFIKEYEDLARGCRLTEQEKCETLLRYIALSNRDLCRSLDEYSNSDWTGFRQELSRIYESSSTEGKYSQQKLSDFIKLASKSRKKEEEDVRQYYRKFLILSKPLLDSQELTKQERDSEFWYGFHPDDRDELTTHLFAKYPDQPKRRVFDFEDVYQVARAVLNNGPLFPSRWQDRREETTR